jgi:single-stranded DNA-binding protein
MKAKPKKCTAYAGGEAWGPMARQCADGCKKDDIIRVMGHLKSSHWCDNDGKFHSRLVVVIDHAEFKNKQPVFDYAFDETKRTASPEEIEAVAKEFFPEVEAVAG